MTEFLIVAAAFLSPIQGGDVNYRQMRVFDDAAWVWTANGDDAKFTVGTRKGAFNGMTELRRMRLKIHSGGTVREIDLGPVGRNGTTASWIRK